MHRIALALDSCSVHWMVELQCALDGVSAVCTEWYDGSVHWIIWLQCALDVMVANGYSVH